MKVVKNASLKKFNQFGVDVKAKFLVQVDTIEDLTDVVKFPQFKNEKKFVLGGGNNTLFVNDFDGVVILIRIMGKKVVKQNNDYVWLQVGAGEDWNQLVGYCVEQNWGGIENLVMIPGTVGGAVAQNIGAYGQNIMDVFERLVAVDLQTGELVDFNYRDCQFEYRNSAFKQGRLAGKYVIASVIFKLKKSLQKFELSYHERKGRYASLVQELERIANPPYTLKDVMKAVISARSQRLPDIAKYGSCGCFFENPVVSQEKYQKLKSQIPDLQAYPADKRLVYCSTDLAKAEKVKIPAARLIDELGFKGQWQGQVGIYKNHALCIVTKRQASGREILNFAKKIQDKVKKEYGVNLSFEVNIVN